MLLKNSSKKKRKSSLISVKNQKYKDILKKHNLKLTLDRVQDFRMTLKEIVDIKNGKRNPDIAEDLTP